MPLGAKDLIAKSPEILQETDCREQGIVTFMKVVLLKDSLSKMIAFRLIRTYCPIIIHDGCFICEKI